MNGVAKMRNMILAFFFIMLCSVSCRAENLIFPNYSSEVSHLELDLELFDFAANYLDSLSKGPLKHLVSIGSQAYTDNNIKSWVHVDPSIIDGTLFEKRERLKKFCLTLFREYQNRFLMIDKDLLRTEGQVGFPAIKMKQSNLTIYVHTSEVPSKFICVWDGGNISYKEDFLKSIK